MSKRYHIFISHAWKYDEHYKTVVQWLDNSGILYSNYSVPQHDPVDANNDFNLKIALINQIAPSSIVLIIAGMYAAYSKWIEYEINEAVRMGKTIVGIEPWGQQRIPAIILNNSTTTVGWNSNSVINAIKTLG